MADEHGGLLTPEWLGRVIDLEFPAMRRFFRPEEITDSALLRRVANLEYLAQRLGSRLTLSSPAKAGVHELGSSTVGRTLVPSLPRARGVLAAQCASCRRMPWARRLLREPHRLAAPIADERGRPAEVGRRGWR